METASALHRVDKQLWLRRKTTPGGTGPAMRDWPAVQEKRRALVTGSAMRDRPEVQEERRLCAWRDYPAAQVKRRRCAARCCQTGPAMQDRPAVQLKRRRHAARHWAVCRRVNLQLVGCASSQPQIQPPGQKKPGPWSTIWTNLPGTMVFIRPRVTSFPVSCKALLHCPCRASSPNFQW